MWFDVIEIGDKAFSSVKNSELKRVFLPSTLKVIGNDVFVGCDTLEVIYYQGSEDDWKKLEINSDISAYKLIFNAEYPSLARKKR